MHKKYEYTSVFADFLNEYIQIHRDAGFKYDNPAYWLYRFDLYCVCANVIEPVITKTLWYYVKKKYKLKVNFLLIFQLVLTNSLFFLVPLIYFHIFFHSH